MSTTSYQKRQALANCHRNGYTSIFTAYDRPSDAKIRAWNYCKNLCNEKQGFNLRVLSKNTFMFTAGFDFCDPETGVLRFAYITPSYDAFVDMP